MVDKFTACGSLPQAILYGALYVCNYLKLKFGALQILIGLTLWFAMLQSGVEASIVGVLFASLRL